MLGHADEGIQLCVESHHEVSILLAYDETRVPLEARRPGVLDHSLDTQVLRFVEQLDQRRTGKRNRIGAAGTKCREYARPRQGTGKLGVRSLSP
jgi:hypothetical protein